MTTTLTTRFARVLGCIAFPLALAAAAPLASAQIYGPELLTNGNFEAGPLKAYSYQPTGWTRSVDGTYWQLTTNLSPAPAGSNTGPVASGNYALRRILFGGTGVGITKANSITYNLSSFTETPVSVGDTLLFSVDVLSSGQDGKIEMYGEIVFRDESNQVILTTETNHIATNVATWNTLTAEIIVPQNAVSFMVSGVHSINTALTGTAYLTYDNFSLKTMSQVPEPATVSAIMALVIGAGVVTYRRRQRKA